MKKKLSDIILEGKIPYFSLLKKALYLLSLGVIIAAPFLNKEFKDFGEFGFNILVFILLIRPLSQVLPEFKILRTISSARREMGILCASFILAHATGYYVKTNQFPHELIMQEGFWQLDNFLVWGVLGATIAVLLLITSNNIAVQVLKGWWKPIQLLAYLFLIFGSMHVFLQEGLSIEGFLESFGFVILIMIVWIMAKRKVRFEILSFFNV